MSEMTVSSSYNATDAALLRADAAAKGLYALAEYQALMLRAVAITDVWRARQNPPVARADEPHLFVMAAEIGYPDEWGPQVIRDDYEREPV